MLLKVCVNGARLPAEHPSLVATPEHVAQEARAAVSLGAAAVHLHAKAADGRDSLAAADVDRYMTAARAACPGTPIGVTTGAWSIPSVADRLAAFGSWTVLPDFASVNWHEDGADDVATLLLGRGVGVEAGVWNVEGLTAWRRSPHRSRCLRVLVELPDLADHQLVVAQATELVASVRATVPGVPLLLHGEDESTWRALDLAAEWGLDTRIGLEDTLLLPDGCTARDNAELVAAAVARLGPDHQH